MRKLALFVLLMAGFVFSQSGQIINSTNGISDVYASTEYQVYVDTFSINPDFGLRLCDAGPDYVGAAYSAYTGSYTYMVESLNLTTGSSASLVYTSNAYNATCYQTPIDAFAFSQFKDSSRTPNVFVSAFPGRIHLLVSSSPNGASPAFVDVTGGTLLGSYGVTSTFNQGTRNVTSTVNSITFDSEIGSFSKPPSDASWGLSSTTGRSMVIGLCTDDYGDNCTAAVKVNDSSQLPVQLGIGAIPIDDQHVYTRYTVVDGLGYGMCLGANLLISMIASPTGMYYGSSSNVTITITNNGNVNVTSAFPVTLNITGPAGYSQGYLWSVTSGLAPGQSVNLTYMWNATDGVQSGTYTFTGTSDPTHALAECDASTKTALATVVVSPYYVVHVAINNNQTYSFPQWGVPYNVSIWLTDPSNNTVSNPTFVITETNGLNPFSPTQVWSDGATQRGLISKNVGQMVGNGTGYAMMTLIPTCNLLYTVYSAENVSNYVGNYSITVDAYANGSQLLLAYNGTLSYDQPLFVANETCQDPGWVNNVDTLNRNRYVTWVYDWLYQMYSITKKLVVA